jgi:hypothetical protein
MQKNKKMAAAMAAVTYYIKSQEEAAAMAAMPAEEKPAPAGAVNLWGVSGRQNQMQMGSLMQMKAFHR